MSTKNNLQHLEFFKNRAQFLKASYSKFSEDQLIATRMMFEITKSIEIIIDSKLAPDGLVAACWPALVLAYCSEESKLTAADINCVYQQNKSTTSRVVDLLIAKDLLKRETDPDDRRKIDLHLTKIGKDYVRKMFPIFASFYNELFAGVDLEILGPELSQVWMNMQNLQV